MRAPTIALALAAGVGSADAAQTVDHYRDLIRPGGHARSEAVFDAALEGCYRQTRAPRSARDTPAMKSCMRAHGYRWQYVEVRRAPTRVARPGLPAARPEPTWTDPETGLTCRSVLVFGIEGSSCSNI